MAERSQTSHPVRSHLFQLRLWKEELEDDLVEWRGRLEHITGEEAYYFRGWEGLVKLLTEALEDDSRE